MNSRSKTAAAWFFVAAALGGVATCEIVRIQERGEANAAASLSHQPIPASAPAVTVTVYPKPDPDNSRLWPEAVSLESIEGEYTITHLGSLTADGGTEGATAFIVPTVAKNKKLRKRWDFTIAPKLDASAGETAMRCSLLDEGRTGYFPATCGSSTITFHIRQQTDGRLYLENYDLVLKRNKS